MRNYYRDALDLTGFSFFKRAVLAEERRIREGVPISPSFKAIETMAPDDALKMAEANLRDLRTRNYEMISIDFIGAQTVLLLEQSGHHVGVKTRGKIRSAMERAYRKCARAHMTDLKEAKYNYPVSVAFSIAQQAIVGYESGGVNVAMQPQLKRELETLAETYSLRYRARRTSRPDLKNKLG